MPICKHADVVTILFIRFCDVFWQWFESQFPVKISRIYNHKLPSPHPNRLREPRRKVKEKEEQNQHLDDLEEFLYGFDDEELEGFL